MNDPELTAEQGREVVETSRTPGWKLIMDRVAGLLADRESDRKDLADELGKEDGRNVETLSLQIARLSGEIDGLKALGEITSTMLRKKAAAEKTIRDHE